MARGSRPDGCWALHPHASNQCMPMPTCSCARSANDLAWKMSEHWLMHSSCRAHLRRQGDTD